MLRRRTAEQLLRGGYLDEGLDAVRVALGQVGMRLAATAGRAMLSLLWHRLWMRIRGTRWRRRDADSLPNRALTRADVCWTVSLVLSMVDHIRGAEIQSRHLLLALRMGEPVRVGRALTMEAAYLATQGEPRRGRMMARWALQIADETQDPYVRAMYHGSMGALHGYSESRWRDSYAEIERGMELFRAHHQAAGWETDTLQFFACENLRVLGELKELCQRVPKYVREAERRGDRYAEVNLRTRFSTVFLAADDPDGAERDLRAAIDSWIPASRAFLVQHYYALHSLCEIHLYRGNPEAASALVREQLGPLRRSFLLTLPAPRSELQFVCGRNRPRAKGHAVGATHRPQARPLQSAAGPLVRRAPQRRGRPARGRPVAGDRAPPRDRRRARGERDEAPPGGRPEASRGAHRRARVDRAGGPLDAVAGDPRARSHDGHDSPGLTREDEPARSSHQGPFG